MNRDRKRELLRKWREGTLNFRQIHNLLELLIDNPWPIIECPECRGEGMVSKEILIVGGWRNETAACPICRGKGDVFVRPID